MLYRLVELRQPLHLIVPDLSYGRALIYLECVDYVILPFFVIPFEFEKPTSKGFSIVKHILMPFLKQGKKGRLM